MNKLEEIKVILANVAEVLEKIDASEPAPVQEADLNKVDMWNLLNDCKASIKGIHACVNSMASDMYSHIYDPMHIPKAKNYQHLDYACKQLGFGKEQAIRNAAYASKVVIST